MKIYFQLLLILKKNGYAADVFSLKQDCSPKYGGCGAKDIFFQMCPATATPFESVFGKGPAASDRGKGSRCVAVSEQSEANPIFCRLFLL